MTEKYTQRIIQRLVDQNRARSDFYRGCNEPGDRDIKCLDDSCRECPFWKGSTGMTMGQVRAMDARIPPTQLQTPVKDGGSPNDAVKSPNHYMLFEGIESIEVIARSMTVEAFRGFCLGNVLKYRLRAGKKTDLANVQQDLSKAEFYKELFEKHKAKCHDAS